MPTLKENPIEAQIVSHRLMLRAGLIYQTASGIYAWLPLGLRVLKKIIKIVREEQNRAGAQELLMPTIQLADLWKESGRYNDYGKELLRISDRHNREMLFGPTNEEMITAIFRDSVKSFRELPKILYHIQWKFRDELRPRFGVMRGREFLMKDGYSFDIDSLSSKRSYNRMFVAYMKTFTRMGLKAIPTRADSGPIGGDLSYEFHILAENGDDTLFVHRDLIESNWKNRDVDYDSDLQFIIDEFVNKCAVTEEKYDLTKMTNDIIKVHGIEVGHIFNFGTKYSKAMNAKVTGSNGKLVELEMGSYGIGVSRLVGALIEAFHDDAGIVWPESVAPFRLGIINLKKNDSCCSAVCEKLYNDLGDDVLYDDRDERVGVKLTDMDLIGLPWSIIVGPRSIVNDRVELKNRKTGEYQELSIEAIMKRFAT
jgi:prolyl-tRNA synthetase